MIKNNYRATVFASCVGYVVQATIINFPPLLLLTFHETYGIPLVALTFLATANFLIQLLTDVVSSKFVPIIGYRKCVIAAHVLATLGLLLLAFLPTVMDPFWGLMLATAVFAVGGGLLEVLVSPIVEACPTKNKAGFMSFLHSFYCWGVVFAVGISTLFFAFLGTERWQVLACLLALIPFFNIFLFARVTIYPIEGDEEIKEGGVRTLFRQKIFWLMLLLMLCSGASEIAVAQWASTFAERALGVSKTLGDVIGVCGFAFMMALARTIYSRIDTKLPTVPALTVCGALCVGAYLVIGLSESAVLGLIGMAVCGFAVGIFWPASFSTATARIPKGGMPLFAFLAVAGDMGCSVGPTVAGLVSGANGDDLRMGLLCAIVFPVLLLFGLLFVYLSDKKEKR